MIVDNQLPDQVSGQTKESERSHIDFNLHETLGAKTQRLLSALETGTVLPIHRHRHTAETYILLCRHINTVFYNADGGEMERYELYPGNRIYEVHIPRRRWHALGVLEPSAMFEVKDGPYMSLDKGDILK